ncbi:hypothetical protein SCLARK_001458 [Spiroplasma clarkii]|uniref:Uncharacterized protein n=1 Tax=Spiroplasma clarkii TaxID=2139 RepID=A0A1Y0L2M9_9MOLU|nr:hypothetical protein [Spiroplasma clarkii]ARU91975.1 hypothetical protein SCLARK_001458 [Spiroplasma clarkii]ATX71315.1 hypothetical protein SCLAR_v1c10130 [Spiroplasma clarkii]
MKKTEFKQEDFKKFEDPRNIMIQLFGIACSVCGIDEIGYVVTNAPKTVGTLAQEILASQPNIEDDDLEASLTPLIDAWQEFDDYNASIGVPTFACDNCYQQLIDGEIQISTVAEQ